MEQTHTLVKDHQGQETATFVHDELSTLGAAVVNFCIGDSSGEGSLETPKLILKDHTATQSESGFHVSFAGGQTPGESGSWQATVLKTHAPPKGAFVPVPNLGKVTEKGKTHVAFLPETKHDSATNAVLGKVIEED